jgi:hypothetical protein
MHSYGDSRTWITTPLIQNNPDYGALLALGLETVDAQPSAYLSQLNVAATFFLRVTREFSSAPGDIQKQLRLIVQSPSAFVASQGW